MNPPTDFRISWFAKLLCWAGLHDWEEISHMDFDCGSVDIWLTCLRSQHVAHIKTTCEKCYQPEESAATPPVFVDAMSDVDLDV